MTRSSVKPALKKQKTIGSVKCGGVDHDILDPSDLSRNEQEVELNRLLVIILAKPIPFVRNKADLKDEAQEQIQEVAFLL